MKIIPLRDLRWQKQARCHDEALDTFFIDHGGTSNPARQFCVECPVRTECLLYALDIGDQYGVWGGADGNERRLMRDRARRQKVDVEEVARRWLAGEKLRFTA